MSCCLPYLGVGTPTNNQPIQDELVSASWDGTTTVFSTAWSYNPQTLEVEVAGEGVEVAPTDWYLKIFKIMNTTGMTAGQAIYATYKYACTTELAVGLADTTLATPYFDNFNRSVTANWDHFSSSSAVWWRPSWASDYAFTDGDEGVARNGVRQEISFSNIGDSMAMGIGGLFSDWLYEGIRTSGTSQHARLSLMHATNGTYDYTVVLYPNDGIIYVDRYTIATLTNTTIGSLAWTTDKVRIQLLTGNEINVGTGAGASFGLSVDISASPISTAYWGYTFYAYDVGGYHYPGDTPSDGYAYLNNFSGYYTP